MKRKTETDHNNETLAVSSFIEMYGGEALCGSDYDHYDRLWTRERHKRFIEVKTRSVKKDAFIDTPIDYSKYMWLHAQPIKTILIVAWTDCVGWIQLEEAYKFDYFRRKDGRSGDHARLCAFYLNKDFEILKEIYGTCKPHNP